MPPLEINYYMNIDQLYDAGEVLQVLKLSKKNSKYCIKLRKLICGGYNILSSNGVSELSFALCDIADSTMSAVSIFVSRTQCFFFSINETLYLVDTHLVTEDAGGKFTG